MNKMEATVGAAAFAVLSLFFVVLPYWYQGGAPVLLEVLGLAQTQEHVVAVTGPMSALTAWCVFLTVRRVALWSTR